MTIQTVDELAAWMKACRRIVAFTGAGISTESGIPDFRSPGGVWSQSQPVYFDDFLRNAEARREYWRQKSITHFEFTRAKPNDGHRVLSAWEATGRIRGVVTQNIDGLHQEAGSRNVVELHGTARQVGCLSCGARSDADPWVRKFLDSNMPPDCPACGGLLKHATISFGQALDEETLVSAREMSGDCDLFLAIGSSLVVHPAAALPEFAKSRGARLVILNRDPTPLDDIADLVVNAPIGATVSGVAELLRGRGA
jgi:NAD-dependent deacetylase